MPRRPRRGGVGYVMARRLWGGARTVMPRRVRRGGGSLMTRHLLRGARPVRDRHARRGARTIRTRRLGQGSPGYVLIRRLRDRHARRGARTWGGARGGARTVMPRGARCADPAPVGWRADGHAPLHAARRGVGHPAPSAGWRRHRGRAARWCACAPSGRCPVLQDGLASATSQHGVILDRGGGMTTALGEGIVSGILAPLWSPRYAGGRRSGGGRLR